MPNVLISGSGVRRAARRLRERLDWLRRAVAAAGLLLPMPHAADRQEAPGFGAEGKPVEWIVQLLVRICKDFAPLMVTVGLVVALFAYLMVRSGRAACIRVLTWATIATAFGLVGLLLRLG